MIMCGDKVGEGRDREVYLFSFDSRYVIKVEKASSFANVLEWKMWQCISKNRKDISHLYAPCFYISKCGKYLIQARTSPLLSPISLEIPSFMWDLSLNNWGLLDGKVVCHDYSEHIGYLSKEMSIVNIQ